MKVGQAAGQAHALLQGMQLFDLPQALLEAGHADAAGAFALRFCTAAARLGPKFFRSGSCMLSMFRFDGSQHTFCWTFFTSKDDLPPCGKWHMHMLASLPVDRCVERAHALFRTYHQPTYMPNTLERQGSPMGHL